MTDIDDVDDMKYHGPGWTLYDGEADIDYLLWAPRGKAPNGEYLTERSDWAACYQDNNNEDNGQFVKGDSMEEVLRVFPKDIAAYFAEVAGASE